MLVGPKLGTIEFLGVLRSTIGVFAISLRCLPEITLGVIVPKGTYWLVCFRCYKVLVLGVIKCQ